MTLLDLLRAGKSAQSPLWTNPGQRRIRPGQSGALWLVDPERFTEPVPWSPMLQELDGPGVEFEEPKPEPLTIEVVR